MAETSRRSPYPLEQTPHFAAYLNRLGEQVEARQTTRDGQYVERRAVQLDRRTQQSHPIGERRSAEEASQPAAADTELATLEIHHQDTERHLHLPHWLDQLTLGKWGYFLAAKLALFWHELISFHPLANLGFLAFVLLPVSGRTLRGVKLSVGLLLAVSLLYYDSWLPPVTRVLSRASSMADFNPSYLFELSLRFLNVYVAAALLLMCASYWLISRWFRAGVLVVAAMLLISLMQLPMLHQVSSLTGQQAGDVAKALPDREVLAQNFFDREALRSVIFTRPVPGAVPFDLVFIHVCSLSWDDVRAVGLDQHPLWQRFDFLFTRFNSAASYSGPAAIHLLRANCGQQEHSKLYLPVRDNCYLLDSLRASGFDTQFALNHKGEFDHFLAQMREYGRISMPLMSQDGLPVAQYAFNNDSNNRAPLYDDLSVLNRWASQRKQSDSARVALFYNTASLHDGNYYPGTEATPNTLNSYRTRLKKFLDEMDAFMRQLEQSERRTVVVMVPEHGGAVRGDKQQIAGLREIPTPAITRVPVGIKVIGGGVQRTGTTLLLDQSTSYLAISHIVERMLEKSPFTRATFAPTDYAVGLPETPFLAQNENITVLEYDKKFYIGHGQSQWDDYTEFNTPVAAH